MPNPPDPMNEPLLEAAEHELEAALATLVPAPAHVGLHQAAFEAGRRAGARDASRWRLATMASCAAAVLMVGVMFFTGGRSETRPDVGPNHGASSSVLAGAELQGDGGGTAGPHAPPAAEASAILRLAHGAGGSDDLGEGMMDERPLTSIERAGSARRASRSARSDLLSILGGV